jgi:hypothetical protein
VPLTGVNIGFSVSSPGSTFPNFTVGLKYNVSHAVETLIKMVSNTIYISDEVCVH